jgi:hypothetical protein
VAGGVVLLLFFVGVALLGRAQEAARPTPVAAPAKPSAAPVASTAPVPAPSATAAARTGFYRGKRVRISGDSVWLYDTAEADREAARIAARKDARAFARHRLAHGVGVDDGTEVTIVEPGFLSIKVRTDRGIEGWCDRDDLRE